MKSLNEYVQNSIDKMEELLQIKSMKNELAWGSAACLLQKGFSKDKKNLTNKTKILDLCTVNHDIEDDGKLLLMRIVLLLVLLCAFDDDCKKRHKSMFALHS